MLFGGTEQKDRKTLARMEVLFGELWDPLRFMADLRAIWPNLDEQNRREIEESRVYREQYHRELAQHTVDKLVPLGESIRSTKFRGIRHEMLAFLSDWEGEEPDKIKILLAMIQQRCN